VPLLSNISSDPIDHIYKIQLFSPTHQVFQEVKIDEFFIHVSKQVVNCLNCFILYLSVIIHDKVKRTSAVVRILLLETGFERT